jgi:peptidoglycan/LPS O-acetylase OafA/YrhL
MKEYFILQCKMTNRKLKDFGLNPLLGYLLILTSFLVLSIFLFHKTEFALYVYILISLALTAKLSEIGRNDFLKLCFNNTHYKLIRIAENFSVTLPFLFFLLYKESFVGSVILVVLSLLLGLDNPDHVDPLQTG